MLEEMAYIYPWDVKHPADERVRILLQVVPIVGVYRRGRLIDPYDMLAKHIPEDAIREVFRFSDKVILKPGVMLGEQTLGVIKMVFSCIFCQEGRDEATYVDVLLMNKRGNMVESLDVTPWEEQRSV
jgi:hypothetical protein